MIIVVVGGSGLIGGKLVQLLRERSHDVVVASPSRGVNAVTGEGLDLALQRADVVIDVSNSPSFEDEAVMTFFTAATKNLLATELVRGVRHHILLSVVGAERMPSSGYMRAKVAQENLLQTSDVPFTIVRATQFFEFIGGIAAASVVDGEVRLPPAAIQPIAADDVVQFLADLATAEPKNSMVELAGPETFSIDQLVQRHLISQGDSRQVRTDPAALYFGTPLAPRTLVPQGEHAVGAQHLQFVPSEVRV